MYNTICCFFGLVREWCVLERIDHAESEEEVRELMEGNGDSPHYVGLIRLREMQEDAKWGLSPFLDTEVGIDTRTTMPSPAADCSF